MRPLGPLRFWGIGGKRFGRRGLRPRRVRGRIGHRGHRGLRARFPRLLFFLNLLAAKVLNRNFIQLDAPYALFDLLFGLLGGRVVFEGELADCIFDKCRVIVHEATAAKNHGALNIGCPVVILIPIVAIDGKADSVVSFECVDLVSCLGTMKINFVVLGVKEVIDGNGIGIAIVAVDGKNAALAIGEQLSRLFIGDGALCSAKRPKPCGLPFFLRAAGTAVGGMSISRYSFGP